MEEFDFSEKKIIMYKGRVDFYDANIMDYKNKSHKIEHNKYDTTKLKRLIPKQFIKISSLKVGKLTCFPD